MLAMEETRASERSKGAEKRTSVLIVRHVIDRWKTIGLITSFFAVASIVVSLLVTHLYTARTSILPMSGPSMGLGNIMGRMGGAESMGGLFGLLTGTDGTSQNLKAILTSRTVAEKVFETTNVASVLYPDAKTEKELPPWEDRLKALRGSIEIRNDENGLIWIGVTLSNPETASSVANSFIDSLQDFLNNNSVSQAKRNRLFIEKQLQRVDVELRAAADEFKIFQRENQMYSASQQSSLALENAASIESILLSKEYELERASKMWSKNSSAYTQLQLEIRALKKQLVRLQASPNQKTNVAGKATPTPPVSTNIIKPLSGLPDLSQKYLELKRNVTIHERVFELLTEQYELAKIQEVKDDIAFTIVDRAKVPEIRTWPRRSLMVIGSTMFGFIVAIMWVLFAAFLKDELSEIPLFRKLISISK